MLLCLTLACNTVCANTPIKCSPNKQIIVRGEWVLAFMDCPWTPPTGHYKNYKSAQDQAQEQEWATVNVCILQKDGKEKTFF